MNNLIVKNFHDKEIHTFFWNNRLCWIAGEVAGGLDYADATNAVSECIKAEAFKDGVEYEILKSATLKSFKQAANSLTRPNLVVYVI